jgi:hypothetical protein
LAVFDAFGAVGYGIPVPLAPSTALLDDVEVKGGGGLAGGSIVDGLAMLVCMSFIRSSFSVFLANTKSFTLD